VGTGIEAEPEFGAMNRSWIMAVEMEKLRLIYAATLPEGRVTGVDSSPKMIAYATRTYVSKRYQPFFRLC